MGEVDRFGVRKVPSKQLDSKQRRDKVDRNQEQRHIGQTIDVSKNRQLRSHSEQDPRKNNKEILTSNGRILGTSKITR